MGFPIFADMDADFAFEYPRMSDVDIILGLCKWVSVTDDEENLEIYAIIKLIKMQSMNETFR